MASNVKGTRKYDSPRRREQAAATRGQILEAAQRLFESQGYTATTMSAIASEAGVALKTVYVVFETKSGILRALWHLLLRGDEGDAPVGERPWYLEALEEPDAKRKLGLVAENSRRVKLRAGALLKVIRDAAPVDPDLAELWGRINSDFYENQQAITTSLAKRKALAKGLDADSAADILWTINHPDLWHLLVGERGWTPERYEKWCLDTAVAQLLR